MFKKLLVAYDGSAGAQKALAAGVKLARIHQAALWALYVQERLPRYGGTIDEIDEEKKFVDERFEKLAAEVRAQAQEAGLEIKMLRPFGHPAQTIVEVAKEGNYDLILVGHSGLSGVWAAFLGTTAEKVSRHAPCSVLIVR
ncbi:MAG: universal stress protein [Desulfobacca sp.]|uniref:universal stress protein n=1 Tax=Desulfobacca sp. TaxID=2067990 RepID=UPI00404B6F9E